MMKTAITWKRLSPEGDKVEVEARRAGDHWRFSVRARRFETWQAVTAPPLEDWLTLLDAIRRRIARGLLRPEELGRVEAVIRERFPDAELRQGK
jgi:hypothetical protein